jgi:hypothetical protein
MQVKINMLSNRKGSNPGGECIIETPRQRFQAYLKYCYGSRVPYGSPFKAENQPIYEAITFTLARELGLKTVNYYILMGTGNEIKFENQIPLEKDHFGRKLYFVSKMVPQPPVSISEERMKKEGTALTKEKPYLESLLISDVIGKKQNYCFGEGEDRPKYIDLGCSFVHAVGGFLNQPNKLKIHDSKETKRSLRRLSTKHIIGADDQRIINLEILANFLTNMAIPVINTKQIIHIREVLEPEEVEAIQAYTIQGLIDSLPAYEKAGLLI